jgi:molybdopterin-guanine dinucleotide biosynthesis protein A
MKLKNDFHPRLFGFTGLSGSGKTTLIEKIIKELANYQIGYIKHDAHKFEMDYPGKDTFRQYAAGAHVVFINDADHLALNVRGESKGLEKEYFKDCDLVLVEGHKYSPHPKFVFLDEEEKLADEIKEGKITNIMGLITRDGRDGSFHRNDVNGIIAFIKAKIEASTQTPYGLVLTGGQSSRMGIDKALISYHGRPQAEYLYTLLEEVGLKTFISCREDQLERKEVRELSSISDRFVNFGPLGGILSAMATHPERAWLVVACDLPLVTAENIKELLRVRDPFKQATAFYNQEREQFEPLFAIYEGTMYSRMLHFLSEGVTCPQKVLFNSSIKKVSLESQGFLQNVNTPEEKKRVLKLLKEVTP